ncbi:MAG: TonB-dependent receptor [Pseudomonadota bacterium]
MQKTRRLTRLLTTACAPAAILAALPGAAQAQVFAEEIVVTATKREQSAQDIGISVTALSGEQITALGYTNAQQVTALAPGVSTIQPNGESNYAVAIRGAANSDFTTNVESPVALYVDEVYISQSSGSGFQLFDTERVEVLRGPQGTLFGRNATGGLIHYISVKPQDELGGYGSVSFGRFNRVRTQGAINVPLSDAMAARVSFATHQGDGYVTNRFRPDRDLNNANDVAGRVQLSFAPNDQFDLLFSASYGRQDIRTGFFEYVSAPLPTGEGQPTSPNPALGGYVDLDGDVFAGEYDFPGRNFLETWNATVTGNYDFGAATLTSITDYRSVQRDYIEDSDASPVNYFNFYLTTDAEQFSQELRLAGDNERVNWVAGAYFIDIQVNDSNGAIAQGFIDDFLGLVDPASVGAFNGIDNPYAQSTTSISGFGQVDIELTDVLSLTLGGRYTRESKDFLYNNDGVLFDAAATSGLDPRTQLIVPNLIPEVRGDQTNDLWSARVVLNYQLTDDLLFYGGWNRGVRGGGFNAPLLPGLTDIQLFEYDPETLNAYEVGMKADLAGGAARLNVSGYYYDYNDYQAFSILGLDTFTQNASAENYGFEAELQASPVDGLDFLFGVGYINANVDDVPGINADAIGSDGSVIAPAFREGSISPVQTPTWNLNGLVRYEIPVPALGGAIALQSDFQYRSEHVFNLSGAASSVEDGYAVVNAAIAWVPDEQPWDVRFAVDNLFDEEYLVQTFDLSGTLDQGGFFGLIEEYYGRPRWWTATVNVQF